MFQVQKIPKSSTIQRDRLTNLTQKHCFTMPKLSLTYNRFELMIAQVHLKGRTENRGSENDKSGEREVERLVRGMRTVSRGSESGKSGE